MTDSISADVEHCCLVLELTVNLAILRMWSHSEGDAQKFFLFNHLPPPRGDIIGDRDCVGWLSLKRVFWRKIYAGFSVMFFLQKKLFFHFVCVVSCFISKRTS